MTTKIAYGNTIEFEGAVCRPKGKFKTPIGDFAVFQKFEVKSLLPLEGTFVLPSGSMVKATFMPNGNIYLFAGMQVVKLDAKENVDFSWK